MANHHKPTKEELEANMKASLDVIEKDKKKEKEIIDNLPPIEEPSPSPVVPSPSPSLEIPSPSPSPEVPSPSKEATPEPTPPVPSPSPDYKKKFVASSTEAEILHSKNKKFNEAIEKAGQIPEPTEEELVAEYPEWDVMSDFEKKIAKNDLKNTKKLAFIESISSEFKDMDKWNQTVDTFLSDPKVVIDNPELEGKEEEFKGFATKESRRGADLGDLVNAFLYQKKALTPAKNKGKMFEVGTGGANDKDKPRSNKISIEESERLRRLDYKTYLKYLKAGRIESKID